MMRILKRGVVGLVMGLWVLVVWAQPAKEAPPFQEKALSAAQFQALTEGGFVLFIRHGSTDNSRPDAYPKVDLADCNTQRPLSDEGRKLIAEVGRYIRSARIPVQQVFYSPMCRARESAQIAFGHLGNKLHQELNLMSPTNLTTEEKRQILATTRQLLAEPVPPGGNRVLVAHAPNLADLMGYFVKPEGTVVVVRPLDGGRFEYLGSIHPTDWPALMVAGKSNTDR